MLSMIVAMSEKDRVIGLDGDMPWKLGADLKRFKKITTGHTVVMGRKTWESIPAKFRPLPNRRNVVLSRQEGYEAEGAQVFTSLEHMNRELEWSEDQHMFLIGGTSVFDAGIEITERIYLTEVSYDGPGDTFFPVDPWETFERDTEWEQVKADDKNSHDSAFVVLRRKPGS